MRYSADISGTIRALRLLHLECVYPCISILRLADLTDKAKGHAIATGVLFFFTMVAKLMYVLESRGECGSSIA